MGESQYGIPRGDSVPSPPCPSQGPLRSPSLAGEVGPAHSLSITNKGALSQSEKRGLGEGVSKGFLEEAGGGPGILWFPVLQGPDLREACTLFPVHQHSAGRALPAPLTEILFHLIPLPLQGPELEWELEAFPLTGLVLGAYLASVVSGLESEVSLEPSLESSLELAFPVSPSSIQGNQEKS